MAIMDPDSKFKGQFKDAFLKLKIHHHLSMRGLQIATLVEHFNRFLNPGLPVFNNDRETNQVFPHICIECMPILGTDLS